jgi:hypothetical protein
LTVFDVTVQAGLLGVSLSALAAGRNVMPPWVAVVLAVGGILLLALTLVWGAALRGVSASFSKGRPSMRRERRPSSARAETKKQADDD